jgi:zinc protease
MDDLKAHFRMGYAPNNCVLIMVGNINPDETIALAKKYLEPIPRQEPPPPIRTKEPEQTGERRVVVEKPAQLPLQFVSYHVPASSHADYAPLTVLNAVLSQGRSSRLYRRLVDRDQLALQVSQFAQLSLDPGQLIVSVQPRSGVELAKVEQTLFAEIELVRSAEIPADELRKAKNQLLAGFYRQLKTIAGKANLLGQYEVYFGDYRKLNNVETELEKVTAADLLRVAKQYLTPRNRTVATLIPEKKEAAK